MLLAILLACFEKTKPEQNEIKVEKVKISEIAKNLNTKQQKVADVIERNFDNMQIPKNITAAAIECCC